MKTSRFANLLFERFTEALICPLGTGQIRVGHCRLNLCKNKENPRGSKTHTEFVPVFFRVRF
jgi:hypothetical protein